MPVPLVDAFFQFFREGGYDDSRVTDTSPQLLGRSPRTFHDRTARNPAPHHRQTLGRGNPSGRVPITRPEGDDGDDGDGAGEDPV
jgi:hypothetical protein